MWWCQFIDWLKFETRPSSLLNFGTAYHALSFWFLVVFVAIYSPVLSPIFSFNAHKPTETIEKTNYSLSPNFCLFSIEKQVSYYKTVLLFYDTICTSQVNPPSTLYKQNKSTIFYNVIHVYSNLLFLPT